MKRLKLQAAILATIASSSYASDTCLPPDIGTPLEVFQCIEAKIDRQQEEIQALKKRWALTYGLVAYYPFDGNANDKSGNGNHGTMHGGVDYVAGRIGQAAYFDGVDDYINVSDVSSFEIRDEASFCFSMNFEQGGSENPRILAVVDDSSRYFDIFTWADYSGGVSSNFRHISYSPNYQAEKHIKQQQVNVSEWYDICFVTNKDTHNLYISGKLIETTLNQKGLTFNTGWLYIGRHSGICSGICDRYKGILDEIRIYNRALSKYEIQQLYQMGN
ncbi:LamG domain-containing protein [Candidatus Parabeggiatoa sp. HSG14]|uniref:LamG domain-containing protein n=1 Tax=Candidatus Parabeggiatoa sp. HSG14 TaxID=3055593 RepID=UPI0025A82236|nr:LamG domain-containing protein [Thiotrichales bacterium HSG14]